MAEFIKEVWVTQWKQSQSLVGRWKNKSCVNGVSATWGCDWKKKAELALELGAGASWRNLALPCPFLPLREAQFFYYFVQLPWSVTGDCSVNIASCQVKRNTFWSPDFWNFIEQVFSFRGMKTFDVLNIKLPSWHLFMKTVATIWVGHTHFTLTEGVCFEVLSSFSYSSKSGLWNLILKHIFLESQISMWLGAKPGMWPAIVKQVFCVREYIWGASPHPRVFHMWKIRVCA